MIKSVIAGAVKGSQNVFRNSNKGILSSAVVANTKFVNTQRFYSSKAGATTSANTFAVVLSGCGFLDGTEITEAVSILVHLSEKGYQAQFFAPNTEQNEVYDHNTRDLEKNEVRNILSESSRITRQKTLPLSQLKARNFEGLILPGGFGVAKNLSTYGNEPNDFTVVPDLATAIKEFYEEKKPIAACCIAPILVAKVLGKGAGGPGCTITLGGDTQVEDHAKALGNEIVQTKATEAYLDESTRVITTPAYMLKNPSPHEVYQGIGQMITQLITATGSKGKKGDEQEDWAFYEWYATTKLGMKKEEWELLKRDAQKREEFKKQKEANK